MTKRIRSVLLPLVAAAILPGCATLSGLMAMIQAPRISSAPDRRAELRLSGLSNGRPLGATLRVWARVHNPNPFGVTLSTVRGSLFLEQQRAADVDLPLGLRLEPRDETLVPIDLAIAFDDVPGLARTLSRAVTGSPIRYRLDGTMGVKGTALDEVTFGPLTLLEGDVQVR